MLKLQEVFIHKNLLKKLFSLKSKNHTLKSNVDKSDFDKLKNVPANLSNLKSKVDK